MRKDINPKKTFKTLFLIVAMILMALPFVTSFDNVFTSLVTNNKLYGLLEAKFAPFTIKMVSVIVNYLGIETLVFPQTIHLAQKGGEWFSAYISWNCIGWQSFLLFGVTLLVGLKGPYQPLSKLEAMVIGILGTFLVNVARITLIVLIGWATTPMGAIIFHDYFSTFIIIAWLFGYWWFSYSFVLETKDARIN